MNDPKSDPNYRVYQLYQACLRKLENLMEQHYDDEEEYNRLEERYQKILTKSNKAMGRFLMKWQPIMMTPEELRKEHQKVRNLIANAGMEFTIEEIAQGKHFLL